MPTTHVWLLHGKSESGDLYPHIAAWLRKPTDDAVHNALIATGEVVPGPIDSGSHAGLVHGGKSYACWLAWHLSKVPVS